MEKLSSLDMKILLPALDLEKAPMRVHELPEGLYLVKLLKVAEVYVEKWNRSCLVWFWEIEDEIDFTLLEGERIISFSGTAIDYREHRDSPAMIALKRHIEALGAEPNPKLLLSSLTHHKVILDIDDGYPPIVKMVPEWYYASSPTCGFDEWIIPYILEI